MPTLPLHSPLHPFSIYNPHHHTFCISYLCNLYLYNIYTHFSLLGFVLTLSVEMAQEIAKNGDAHNGTTATFSAMKTQLFVEATKANDAVEFYKAAFGAEEINRVTQPKRKADQELPLVMSAELKLGDSIFIVSDDSSAP